jgi:hypothetical protein
MKKCLLLSAVLAVAAMSMPALACSEIKNISGISQEERQSMVVECEKIKLKSVTTSKQDTSTPKLAVEEYLNEETLTKMGSIAKTAGATVREVAKELNVATNEFIKTPVGLLTAGLAIWYVAGDNISGLIDHIWGTFGGIVIICLVLPLGNRLRKSLFLKDIEHKTVKTLFGNEKVVDVKTYYTWKEIDSDTAGWAVLITVAQGLGIIIGLAFMF